jgi:hypothetical protein
MLPEAKCIHRTPGRVRISIPARKGDSAYFAHVQESLARCPLVTAARANPVTGSVLVTHTGEMAAIAAYADKNNLFGLIPDRKNPGSVAHATIATYKTLDAQIQKISGGELDLPHTAFLTLVGAGIYQISRGKFGAPAWYTAFWYALNIFLKAQAKKEKSG